VSVCKRRYHQLKNLERGREKRRGRKGREKDENGGVRTRIDGADLDRVTVVVYE